MVISGITVPANGVATLIYAARTNEYAPLGAGGSIVNTAVINGGGITELAVTPNCDKIISTKTKYKT